MKIFLEKIKENKLRSVLVGMSAFLFGFISVSVFNNIGDTYAESSSDYYCYNSEYQVVSNDGNYYCCPKGYNYTGGYCGKDSDAQTYNDAVENCGSQNVTQSSGVWYCTVSATKAIKKETSTTQVYVYFDVNATDAVLTGNSSLYCSYNPNTADKCNITISNLPTAKRDGYIFNGWGTSKTCTVGSLEPSTISLQNSKTYYACWVYDAACYENIASGDLEWGYIGDLDGYTTDWTLTNRSKECCKTGECNACYENIASGDLEWGYIGDLDGYTTDWQFIDKNEEECINEEKPTPGGDNSGNDNGNEPIPNPGGDNSGNDDGNEPIPNPGGDNSGNDDGKEPTPNPGGDNSGKDEVTGKEPSNDKTDQEITENEKTGTAMIIVAWVIGLSALGYSTYYIIRKNREDY